MNWRPLARKLSLAPVSPLLGDLSIKKYGKPFLDLTDLQRRELLVSVSQKDASLKKFFDALRHEAIRGYYTSAEGLEELDYKWNAYYPECPDCAADASQIISQKT